MRDKDPLGDRMKEYEAVTRLVLPRRTYTVLRMDGRAFHTFLRKASKPFDENVIEAMRETTRRMCQVVDGTVLGYTQSDEISLILQDFAQPGTQPWFGSVVQKMASVAAAETTARFIQEIGHRTDFLDHGLPVFDARVFTIPSVVEVANYLVWRQKDAIRNSIQALGQAFFSPRTMHGLNTAAVKNLLSQGKGIDWEKDVSQGCRQGWLVQRVSRPNGEALVTRWETDAAPEFRADGTGLLPKLLPEPHILT